MSKRFVPAKGLKNKHFQTLYSSFFKPSLELDFEIERFVFNDGDFTECYWYKTQKNLKKPPVVVLFHGLAGSYKSPYVQSTMQKLSKAGFDSVLVHFRGSLTPNNLPRSYHSGDTQDAKEVLKYIKQKYPNSKLFAIGYSIGGNMLLKLLGELGKDTMFYKAVSVSAPMQLDICADCMQRGFSRFYQYILLKDLKKSLQEKFERFDMQSQIGIQKSQIKDIKTFWEFDNIYTAPIHGFKNAKEYYKRCSSKQFLKDIKTKTLIIHSKDDPFMNIDILPNESEISSKVQLEIYDYGGHVGFISGSVFSPKYWLEDRIVNYFR